MAKLFFILLLPLLVGCKTVFVFSVQKDWAVESTSIANPDLKTQAEIRFEYDPNQDR